MKEVSIVEEPANKHARMLQFTDEGVTRDFMTWRRIEKRWGRAQLHITERIWLRAFGTTPKFSFGGLQICSGTSYEIAPTGGE